MVGFAVPADHTVTPPPKKGEILRPCQRTERIMKRNGDGFTNCKKHT